MIANFLYRHKIILFALVWVCFIAAHYWFLGFTTWDGLSYRIPPIVEFVQHGDLGGWKFDVPAAQNLYPFFEWLHVPFLMIFGLTGLYFSFSLLLLPLSVAAVYGFVRELTGDRHWATYSALAYLAIPFVNTQPFSGYIDFAVVGALAFFLLTLLRVLRLKEPRLASWALFSLATFVFSMSRQHTPYLAAMIAGVVTCWSLLRWGRTISSQSWGPRPLRRLDLLIVAFGIGILPAASLHLARYLAYGTPIYPYQFHLLGMATREGLTPGYVAAGAGLVAPGWTGLLAGFRRGWLMPDEWPAGFFDSRLLGAGLLFWLALAALPVLRRVIDRDTAFLIGLFVLIPFLTQDFWLPRWSMTLVLTLVLCLGGALAELSARGPSWAFALLFSAVVLHLGRPIYDVFAMARLHQYYVRINLSASSQFINNAVAPGEVLPYPDLGADFLIVHPLDNGFSLPLYGRNLSNQIAGTLDPAQIDGSCNTASAANPTRRTLIVDQSGKLQQLSGTCEWVCEYRDPRGCLAGTLIRAGN